MSQLSSTEREQELEDALENNTKAFRKRLQTIEDDHRNRLQKMEALEKERLDLKKMNITLEKDNIQLGVENLRLIKENLALKKEM